MNPKYYAALRNYCTRYGIDWRFDTIQNPITLIWQVLKVVNELVGDMDELQKAMEDLISSIEGTVEQKVLDKLQEWINDGTLETLINETLFNSKADKTYVDGELEDITAQLAQKTTQIGYLTTVVSEKASENSVNLLNDRIDTILTTPSDVITDQEIIDARHGETSLGKNILKIGKETHNVFLINDGTPPTYTPGNKTLIFHSKVNVIVGKKYYDIEAGTTVINDSIGSNASVLLFNTVNSTLRFEAYYKTYSDDEVPIAYFRTSGRKSTVSANFDIDITDSTVSKDMNVFMLLGEKDKYPIIDTLSKTITFPPTKSDIIFIVNGAVYPGAVPSTGKIIDFSNDIGSSAGVILWEKETNNFITTAFSDAKVGDKRYGILATFRFNGGGYAFNMLNPFTQDGVQYGLGIDKEAIENIKNNVIQNPLETTVKAIAHRGYTKDNIPENTLASFRHAKKNGFSYVETDVRTTKDGVPVLLHDETIDRTSNGTGKISELNYSEVKDLDFGSWASPDFAGEKIPTFEDFIITCKNLNLHPYIEILSDVDPIFNIVKKYGMLDKVSWIGGLSACSYILSLHPKSRVGVVSMTLDSELIDTVSAMKTDINTVFLDVHTDVLTKELVQEGHEKGLQMECWIWWRDEQAVIDAVKTGIDGVTVDNHNVAAILQRHEYGVQ